jgi:cell wall assembly regulator SMI1
MTVEYRRREPAASPELIDRLERRIGRPLPDSYRHYLLQQDGGRLASNDQAVNTVFGLGDVPDWASMWDVLDTYAGRMPGWLLPVADDEYGNVFAISLRDGDRGSVWFWDHEEESGDNEEPAEDNIRRVASDWPAFLQSLGPPPEPAPEA